MQTHPMPAERVRALAELARTSPYWDKKDSPALQQRHDLMRAKLYGFMDRPDAVAAPLSGERHQPAGALCARDRGLSLRQCRRARSAQIDALIQAQPQNPYFHELKGQALLEGGKPAEAIAPLRRAVQLAPNPALIQIMLAQALLATNDTAHADEAVTLLETALRREPESSDAYTQLAMAYGRKGDLGPRRSLLGAGRLHARRPADRAPARGPRQDPLPGRLARLGQGRRHRHLQPPEQAGQRN